MSRLYDFQVCFKPLPQGGHEAVVDVAQSELGCYDVNGYDDGDGGGAIWGHTTLCGGESDQEADKRFVSTLREKFPELESIETSWRCMEYSEWDNEYAWKKECDTQPTEE